MSTANARFQAGAQTVKASSVESHMQTVERVIGGLLVVTGVLFLTGTFSEIAYWLLEAFPALGTVG